MTVEQLKNRLNVRIQDISSKRLKRKTETVFKYISEAAARWKKQARRYLGKPASRSLNRSLYPRKRTGKLQNSIYYSIKKHIGKTKASLTIYYGFHEVYSTHGKAGIPFYYGKYLNEAPATYRGYRERLYEKLISRIETIQHRATI